MIVLLLLACGASDSASSVSDTTPGGAPTWYADVKPIVDAQCMPCHATGLAPAFPEGEALSALSALMAARVADGSMPPAAPDPECRPYAGADTLVLDDSAKATIAAWAEAGGPLGDAADDQSSPLDPLDTTWDMDLYATSAYAPSFDATGNDYRCFLLDLANPEPLWLTGFGAIVDNRTIVHHVVVYEVSEGTDVNADPSGFYCDGLGENGWDFLVGWAPGGRPVQLAEGQAISVAANTRYVLQMHYFGDATKAGEVDQSGFGLKVSDEAPEHVIFSYPLGDTSFTVPAGDAAYEVTTRTRWPDGYGTLNIVGVMPHMHLLGRGFQMEAGPNDGKSCLVDSDPWDFHNQVALVFDEPVAVEPGDQIKAVCTFDNSATSPYQYNDPPQDVGFGENTDNEMCFAFTYGYLD